jgi:hypothetical protein
MAGRTEINTEKYTAGDNVDVVDPYEFFQWPQFNSSKEITRR